MATVERFARDAYREELRHAAENYEVGTTLLFENDEIRVWSSASSPASGTRSTATGRRTSGSASTAVVRSSVTRTAIDPRRVRGPRHGFPGRGPSRDGADSRPREHGHDHVPVPYLRAAVQVNDAERDAFLRQDDPPWVAAIATLDESELPTSSRSGTAGTGRRSTSGARRSCAGRTTSCASRARRWSSSSTIIRSRGVREGRGPGPDRLGRGADRSHPADRLPVRSRPGRHHRTLYRA